VRIVGTFAYGVVEEGGVTRRVRTKGEDGRRVRALNSIRITIKHRQLSRISGEM